MAIVLDGVHARLRANLAQLEAELAEASAKTKAARDVEVRLTNRLDLACEELKIEVDFEVYGDCQGWIGTRRQELEEKRAHLTRKGLL